MSPPIQELTADNIVEFLASIFERRGSEEYLGEPVTMGEHMLQGATIAEQNGQPDEIVVGALLHDIGHFTSEFGTFSMEDTEDTYRLVVVGVVVVVRVAPPVTRNVNRWSWRRCKGNPEGTTAGMVERIQSIFSFQRQVTLMEFSISLTNNGYLHKTLQ